MEATGSVYAPEAAEVMNQFNDTCYHPMMIYKADAVQLMRNGHGYLLDPYTSTGLFNLGQTRITNTTRFAETLVKRVGDWVPNNMMYELAVNAIRLCMRRGSPYIDEYASCWGASRPELDKIVAEYQEKRVKELLEK